MHPSPSGSDRTRSTSHRLRPGLAALLLGLACACGEGAGKADAVAAAGPGVGASSDLASSADVLPPGHPAVALEEAAAEAPHHWDGTVHLRGSLAGKQAGYLFVSVEAEGVRMPSYSVKVDVAGGTDEADGRAVPFSLTEANRMGGLMAGMDRLVLAVCFDPDGIVETKEGQVEADVPVTVDQTGVEVVLPG